MAATLWKHQQAVRKFLASNGVAAKALLMWPRTGKTLPIIEDAESAMKSGKITALIVVAPLGVHEQWVDVWNEHTGKDQDTYTLVHAWQGGGSKRERTKLVRLERANEIVFTINWDALNTKRGFAVVEKLLLAHKAILVADESHRMKTPSAKRAKAMVRLGRLANWRRILTGTPIANNPLDLYMQFRFLDPRILGYDSYWPFRSRYARTKRISLETHHFDKIIGYSHLDELREKIAPYSFIIGEEEAHRLLELPPKVYSKLPVNLSPEQSRLYNSLVDDLVARLDGGEQMTAILAIVQLTRLQQLLSGWFTPDSAVTEVILASNKRPPGHFLSEAPIPREQVLLDLLEDQLGKVVIWCRFIPERQRLANLISKAKLGSGIIVNKGTDGTIQKFQEDKALRFLIASPEGAASEGRDFSMADTIIYYSNSFKLTARQQSEERLMKKGRKGNVHVFDLLAKGTVDVKIVANLREKRDIANKFSAAKLREWIT